jgi:hypothetical protein
MNTYLLCREDMFEGLRINWSQSAELIIFLASFNARAKKNRLGQDRRHQTRQALQKRKR